MTLRGLGLFVLRLARAAGSLLVVVLATACVIGLLVWGATIGGFAGFVIALALIVWVLVAALCAEVALGRGRTWWGWFFVGLGFGIFALAVLLVLPREPEPQDEKTCPYCISQIPVNATVCRYCQRDLPTPSER